LVVGRVRDAYFCPGGTSIYQARLEKKMGERKMASDGGSGAGESVGFLSVVGVEGLAGE
jgi:hypothetical protein